MNRPHYSYFPLHPYHLDAAMRHYFPECGKSSRAIGVSNYAHICNAIERLVGVFPNITMDTIERYCEGALPHIPKAATACSYGKDYKTVSHDNLLAVILYANIEEWEHRLFPESLLPMAEALKEAINFDEDMGEDYDYSADEEAHDNLINDVRQSGLDEMDDADPYWRIAND